MTNVNIRLPVTELELIDRLVNEGRFASRSDAIRMMVSFYEDRERTREFYLLLEGRSRDARENPKALIPLEAL